MKKPVLVFLFSRRIRAGFFFASVADRMLVLCVYGNLAFARILNLCKVSCADAAVKK